MTTKTSGMPQFYVSIEQDYVTLSNEAALAYATNTGRFWIHGKDALDLLNRISTQQLADVKKNEVSFTVQTTNKGRIIDFLTVTNLGDRLLVFTALEAKDSVMDSIDFFSFDEDVKLEDCTAETELYQLFGDEASTKIISLLQDESHVPDINQAKQISVSNEEVIIIRTDRVKIPTYEILAMNSSKSIHSNLTGLGLPFVGTKALEIFRIEKGIPVFGSELTERFNPIEAGLSHAISFDKGCYVGQEVVARLNTYDKVKRQLIRLNWNKPGIKKGDDIFSGDQKIGEVTSCAQKTHQNFVGLGYLARNSNLDEVTIGSQRVTAKVSKTQSD